MVKTIKIAEAQAAYKLGVNEEQLAQEPIILERDGEPVAAIVPFPEYREFAAWREQRERARSFDEERAAFYEMKDALLDTYAGQYVAVRNGHVVDSGSDPVDLAMRVYARFGYVPIYVGLVSEEPEVVEFPSPEILD